ncbi:MAG: hypothetical protein EBU83_04190 [bacterium]|nr:hypothetical protein [Candidatus Aquidulcis sp.]
MSNERPRIVRPDQIAGAEALPHALPGAEEPAPDAGDLMRGVLLDERYEPGMIKLDRQPVPIADDGLPAFVPELEPTPLRGGYIYLSVVALVCGTIVISALNLGARWSDGVVKVPLLIGAVPLFIAMAEAALRIARSVGAWWPISRGRALFRAGWVLMIGALAAIVLAAIGVALSA